MSRFTPEEFAQRCGKPRRQSYGWLARCPAHDDRRSSLSIGTGTDGRVLLKCHAGCSVEDIAAAVGVQLNQLFADEPKQAGDGIEATYDYRDAAGRLLFQVVRKTGKRFMQRRPLGDGSWSWRLGDVERVLYRLPELQAVDVEDPVFVVEGEKDCDRLRGLGLASVSASGGAGKWRPEYAESLRARNVVVLPDNDTPGWQHAVVVAESLRNVATRIRVLKLNVRPKGDVSDWLDAGGTKEQLLAEVSRTPEWEFDERQKTAAEAPAGFTAAVQRIVGIVEAVARRAKSSQPLHVGFLDDMMLGVLETDLVVLGAPTGAGKTTLASVFAESCAAAGARVAYFALEAHDSEIEQRMLYRRMAKRVWQLAREGAMPHALAQQFTYAMWCHGRVDEIVERVAPDAIADLRRCIGDRLQTLYRSGDFGHEDLANGLRRLRGHADLVIVDHLHFLDATEEELDENRHMRRTVKAISDAIVDAGTPVVAVAHLRKQDIRSKRIVPHIAEFHGSSEVTKIATRVVTLAPAYRDTHVPGIAPTYMRVSKDRIDGAKNVVAVCDFDLRQANYRAQYELGRLRDGDTRWEELPVAEIPWWAKREKRVCHA